MTKTTKYINATYRPTGHWTIRDNGVVIREGQGLFSYGEALAEVRATATKKVKEHNEWL